MLFWCYVTQVYSFLSNLLMHLCSWILAMMVLEVTLVLTFPKRAHLICVAERVKNITLVVVLMLTCVNAHFFWTYGLVRLHPLADHVFCIFTQYGGFYSKYFRGIIWPILDSLFSAILPNSLILGCLVYVGIRGYLRPKRMEELLHNHFIVDPESLWSVIRLTIILGALSILLTLPETAYNIFEFAMERMALDHIGDRETFFAQRTLAQLLCYTTRDFFLSFKILLYIVCWRKFREKAFDVVTLRSCRTYLHRRKSMREEYTSAAYRDHNEAATVVKEQTREVKVQKRDSGPALKTHGVTNNASISKLDETTDGYDGSCTQGLLPERDNDSKVWLKRQGYVMTNI